MPSITLNGTELFYQIVGTGYPCFILHGGLGLDHSYLQQGLAPLGDRLQLIAIDHRGNGRSGRPPLDTLTFAQFCADLDALRQHLHYERVALLGHSYGGFIALEYAWRYPDRVSQLILLDTVASLDYQEEMQANLQRLRPSPAILAALAAEPTTDAEFQQVLQTITPLYFHTYDPHQAERAFQHVIWSVTANQRGFELMDRYDMRPYLPEIQVPTLCLVGDSDFLALVPQVQLLVQGLPQAEMVVIEQCGHFPFIEQPAAFLQAVSAWLKQQV